MEQDHHNPTDEVSGLVISEEVLAAIAVTAARDVEGVSAILPRIPGVAHLIRGDHLRYVKIAGEGTELTVELLLRVRAGAKMTRTASGVQHAVKNALQGMTGRPVARVNLKILGADF